MAALQRLGDDQVREPRVLGQQRPVDVGADHAAVANTLVAVLSIVAAPAHNPAERLQSRPEVGAAGVVLKPDQRARLAAPEVALAA